MNKYANTSTQRRQIILKLIGTGSVSSQEELLKLLNQHGFKVTQPTLSRDLHVLGIAKTPSGYVTPDLFSPISPLKVSFAPSEKREEKLNQVLREFVASMEPAGSLVVLRTPSAGAQPVARALDEASLPEVAGTIAGDDTVFVAARSSSAARRIIHRFSKVLNLSHPKHGVIKLK